LLKHGFTAHPTADRWVNAQFHTTLLGELEGVRQQILEHLLQPLRVGDHAAIEFRIDPHVERQAPAPGFVPKRPKDHVLQRDKEYFLASTVTVPDSIFDRSRMSLIRFIRSV